jgi:hypothetical protein
MLISRRTVVNMMSGPRAQPPVIHELLAEAQRLRQVRGRAEYQQHVKLEVSKAIGGVKSFLFGGGKGK